VLELEFPDPTLQDFVVTKLGNLRVAHYKNLGCSSEELQTIARKINEASRVLELDSGLKLVEEVIIPERDCAEAASNNGKTIMLSKSLARVLAESTAIKPEEQLTLVNELAHLLFCHYEKEIQGSHLESAWDKLIRPNRLLLLMLTEEYLTPKTARVSKVRRNLNFCITLGHPDDNLHELFASLVNTLYIEEARENLRYLESSSMTVRAWLESFILPRIN